MKNKIEVNSGNTEVQDIIIGPFAIVGAAIGGITTLCGPLSAITYGPNPDYAGAAAAFMIGSAMLVACGAYLKKMVNRTPTYLLA